MYWFAAFLILMAGLGLYFSVSFILKCECEKQLKSEEGAILFAAGLWALILVIFAIAVVFTK